MVYPFNILLHMLCINYMQNLNQIGDAYTDLVYSLYNSFQNQYNHCILFQLLYLGDCTLTEKNWQSKVLLEMKKSFTVIRQWCQFCFDHIAFHATLLETIRSMYILAGSFASRLPFFLPAVYCTEIFSLIEIRVFLYFDILPFEAKLFTTFVSCTRYRVSFIPEYIFFFLFGHKYNTAKKRDRHKNVSVVVSRGISQLLRFHCKTCNTLSPVTPLQINDSLV